MADCNIRDKRHHLLPHADSRRRCTGYRQSEPDEHRDEGRVGWIDFRACRVLSFCAGCGRVSSAVSEESYGCCMSESGTQVEEVYVGDLYFLFDNDGEEPGADD